jgi:hypothetical protein
MKHLKNKIPLVLLLVVGCFLASFVLTNDENYYKPSSWFYNDKGQLKVDTTIVMDSRIASSFLQGGQPDIYNIVIHQVSFPELFVTGAFRDKFLMKLRVTVSDTNNRYGMITEVSFLEEKNDEYHQEMQEILRNNIVDTQVWNCFDSKEYHVHLPIRYEVDLVKNSDFIPFEQRIIKDGFLVIYSRTYRVTNH